MVYLKCHVGVSGTDGSVINQSLNIVHHDARHRTLVSVIEDFPDCHAFGRLCEADHIFRAADLDEGESGVPGDPGGHGALAGVRRPLEEDGDETRAPSRGLLDSQLPILEDVLYVRAPVNDASREETCTWR